MKILGLETSCDETAAALLQVSPNKYHVLNNVVLSQVDIHKKYGGIVPEVAARKHVEAIIPVIQESLAGAKPDLIAVTKGPGLITSLQVGVQTAKTLSYAWKIPLVAINHLEAHLWSFLLNNKGQNTKDVSRPTSLITQLPAIGLIISGGHTELILVKGIGKYKLIGRTRDDAVGEAFDKVAKMMELGYPGGPIISHFAKEGNQNRIKFPRPMLESGDFDFSFSGLKTAVKYHLKEMMPTGNLSQAFINDISASFQKAVIDVLVAKTIKAAEKFKAKSIILGGGVSANQNLIEAISLKAKDLKMDFYHPEFKYTGDNAAMVALSGYFNLPRRQASQKKARLDSAQRATPKEWQKLVADCNLKLV